MTSPTLNSTRESSCTCNTGNDLSSLSVSIVLNRPSSFLLRHWGGGGGGNGGGMGGGGCWKRWFWGLFWRLCCVVGSGCVKILRVLIRMFFGGFDFDVGFVVDVVVVGGEVFRSTHPRLTLQKSTAICLYDTAFSFKYLLCRRMYDDIS